MPFIPTGGGPGSIPVANLAPGLLGQVIGGTTPSYVYPPGFEINYTQITASASVTDTAEATATALLSPGAITFDGSPVIVEFFCPHVQTDSAAIGDTLRVTMFEGATQIGRLGAFNTTAAQLGIAPMKCEYRFTPTAGSHTYKICAFVPSTTGTPILNANVGGTGLVVPTFVRFRKV